MSSSPKSLGSREDFSIWLHLLCTRGSVHVHYDAGRPSLGFTWRATSKTLSIIVLDTLPRSSIAKRTPLLFLAPSLLLHIGLHKYAHTSYEIVAATLHPHRFDGNDHLSRWVFSSCAHVTLTMKSSFVLDDLLIYPC